MSNEKQKLTVAIIGQSQAGKTSLLHLFLSDKEEVFKSGVNIDEGFVKYNFSEGSYEVVLIEQIGSANKVEKFPSLMKAHKLPFPLLVIWVLDISQLPSSEEVLSPLDVLLEKLGKQRKKTSLYVFAHKTDLIPKEKFSLYKLQLMNLMLDIAEDVLISIAFTCKQYHSLQELFLRVLAEDELPIEFTRYPEVLEDRSAVKESEKKEKGQEERREEGATERGESEERDVSSHDLPKAMQARSPLEPREDEEIEAIGAAGSVIDGVQEDSTLAVEGLDEEIDSFKMDWDVVQGIKRVLEKSIGIILDISGKAISLFDKAYQVNKIVDNVYEIRVPIANTFLLITYLSRGASIQGLRVFSQLVTKERLPLLVLHDDEEPGIRIENLYLINSLQDVARYFKIWVILYNVVSTSEALKVILEEYQFDETVSQELYSVIQGFDIGNTAQEIIGICIAHYTSILPELIDFKTQVREFEEDTLIPYIRITGEPTFFDQELFDEGLPEHVVMLCRDTFYQYSSIQKDSFKEYKLQDYVFFIIKFPPLVAGICLPEKHRGMYKDVIDYFIEDFESLSIEFTGLLEELFKKVLREPLIILELPEQEQIGGGGGEQTMEVKGETEILREVPSVENVKAVEVVGEEADLGGEDLSQEIGRTKEKEGIEVLKEEERVQTVKEEKGETTSEAAEPLITILYPFFKSSGEPILPELEEETEVQTVLKHLKSFLQRISKEIVETPYTTSLELGDFKIYLRTGDEIGVVLIVNSVIDEEAVQRLLTKAIVHTALYIAKTIQTPRDKQLFQKALQKLKMRAIELAQSERLKD